MKRATCAQVPGTRYRVPGTRYLVPGTPEVVANEVDDYLRGNSVRAELSLIHDEALF